MRNNFMLLIDNQKLATVKKFKMKNFVICIKYRTNRMFYKLLKDQKIFYNFSIDRKKSQLDNGSLIL